MIGKVLSQLDHSPELISLQDARPLYILPADPLAEEVLIPGFQAAGKVDCMVGFFSSAVLSELAPGLATYIASAHRSFRLIIRLCSGSLDLTRSVLHSKKLPDGALSNTTTMRIQST